MVSKVILEVCGIPFRIASSFIVRRFPKSEKPPLFLFGFSRWKTFMHDWFPNHEVIFAPSNTWPIEFDLVWKRRILMDRRSEVLAWQYKGPSRIKEFCRGHGVSFHYVEDGFIRSLDLGALHTPPMSLAFDCLDMYFNANAPTDLEDLLASYDFEADPELLERARRAIARILDTGISKYNSGVSAEVEQIYGPKTRKRILVIGQVEQDASIAYGSTKRYTNNELVWLARRENPDAQIIYKPHPEVLRGIAKAKSDPNAVRGIAQVLDQNISLADSLNTIDHVYTITSLSGFEALLRGLKVSTIGCPFYSGWGLTDDRQPNERRKRNLTVDQVFAAAYILYPRYFDPVDRQYIEIEQALDTLAAMRMEMPGADQAFSSKSGGVKELAGEENTGPRV